MKVRIEPAKEEKIKVDDLVTYYNSADKSVILITEIDEEAITFDGIWFSSGDGDNKWAARTGNKLRLDEVVKFKGLIILKNE